MKNLLQNAVQQKRKFLINQLISSGVYKKNNKHLFEWTLSELEKEYQFVETNELESNENSKQPL